MGVVRRFAFDKVEGLRTGRFDLALNTSVVLYHMGKTLVDAGPPNRWSCVCDFLKDRPVRRVLLTHHHEDHSGNAARIQATYNAQVLAHTEALVELAKGWRLRPYQGLLWGQPPLLTAQPVPDLVELEDGLQLKVLHVPGHSRDSVCYLEPERGWLFTGDLYIGSQTRYLRRDENLPLLIESLRSILRHDFNVVFCGHRGVVAKGYQALAEKLDYLVTFSEQVKELRGRGVSVKEISRRLLGREDLVSFVTLGHFNKVNLVRGCLGGSG